MDPVVLSNTAQDVTQKQSIARKHPDVVNELAKLHERSVAKVNQQ